MTIIVGGLRSRLIFDSTYKVINDGLTALGWFAGGRHHAPVTFVPDEQDVETEVPLNTLALSDENVSSAEIELGSMLSDNTRTFYLDFFAEEDALGKHLIGDCRDLLQGRMPSIGRTGPAIAIYDFRQATPPVVFYVQVEGVRIDRAHNFPHPWAKHWYSIQFDLVDSYSDENDAGGVAQPTLSTYDSGSYDG